MISLLLLPLAAALLASISGGVIGSYVIVKRLANMCGSITHSILGGMGFFLWLQKAKGISWCDPLIGAFLASIVSALLIGWIQLRFRERVDAVIAAVWSTGMAIGVIFLALTPGSTGDLSNFLLGNLLWITPRDLAFLFGLNLLILLVVSCYYRAFLLISFDEDQALLQRIPVQKITFLLLTLIALAIVLFIQMIGTILTIALLTLPATTANLFVQRLRPLMVGAILCNALVSSLGIGLSYLFDFPPGATISLCAALLYFAALIVKKKKIFLPHPSPLND
jgi:zinc transport system permease protein